MIDSQILVDCPLNRDGHLRELKFRILRLLLADNSLSVGRFLVLVDSEVAILLGCFTEKVNRYPSIFYLYFIYVFSIYFGKTL